MTCKVKFFNDNNINIGYYINVLCERQKPNLSKDFYGECCKVDPKS